MESYLNENFGEKPKQPSAEVLEKWRNLCGVVKNPERRFRFTANLSTRYEAAAMRKTNQEKLRIAVLVSKVAMQFIEAASPKDCTVPEKVEAAGFQVCAEELGSIVEGHYVKKLKLHEGVPPVAEKLSTSITDVLNTDTDLFNLRQEKCGINRFAESKAWRFWLNFWKALHHISLMIIQILEIQKCFRGFRPTLNSNTINSGVCLLFKFRAVRFLCHSHFPGLMLCSRQIFLACLVLSQFQFVVTVRVRMSFLASTHAPPPSATNVNVPPAPPDTPVYASNVYAPPLPPYVPLTPLPPYIPVYDTNVNAPPLRADTPLYAAEVNTPQPPSDTPLLSLLASKKVMKILSTISTITIIMTGVCYYIRKHCKNSTTTQPAESAVSQTNDEELSSTSPVSQTDDNSTAFPQWEWAPVLQGGLDYSAPGQVVIYENCRFIFHLDRGNVMMMQ